MKYNTEYDVWVSKEGVIFYLDSNNNLHPYYTRIIKGYEYVSIKRNKNVKLKRVHRIVWETFNGKIIDNLQVDHINNKRDDNRLCNLQLLTGAENLRKAHKGKQPWNKNISTSEFGKKFNIMFNTTRSENPKLYSKEYEWYKRHGKCRWEAMSNG